MENLSEISGQNEIEGAQIVFYIDGEDHTIGDLQSTPSIPKKPRALVYQFFEWEQESARYKCNLCEYANLFNVEVGYKLLPENLMNYRKTYAVPKSGGTGSLNNHMIRKHQGEFENAKKAKGGNGAPSSSNQEARNSQVGLNDDRISSDVFRHKLITFLVCCDEPFTLTENEYFKDLIDYISGKNDECRLFSAKTTKGLIADLYDEYKSNIKSALLSNEGKISFVIDCWTSSNQYPFQGVIARWINDEWELCSTVLDLTILHGTHEGKNLANAFWDVLKEYNLFAKVLSVTTDNASNMDTLFEELEKLFSELGIPFDSKNYRIRCFAHIMNLACQAMIYSVGDGPATEYPSDDSDDEDNEKATQKSKVLPVVAKMRKGVVSIRSSPQRRELLARQCIAANIVPKVVLRDVRTRWNATHRMMERSIELKEPFDLTLRSIPKKRKYCLDEMEWEKVKDLLALLEPFREATEMLSNEHSPTLSRVSAVYQALFDHLEKFKTIDREQSQHPSKRVKRNTSITTMPSPWLSKAAEDGLAKLEKYYPSTDGLVHIVNTVLDPRCKLVWFKATGWPKEWIDHSRKCFTELYKSNYKPKNSTGDENIAPLSNTEPKKHFFKDLFSMQMKNYQKTSTDDELKTYLTEAVVDPELLIKEKTGIDGVLGWWKIHQKEYPNLAKMAKDFLAAAGTGVPVERLFSSGPDTISNRQQSMKPETIKMRICLKAWLRSKNSFNKDIANAIAHKLGVVDENDESAL